MTDPTPLGVVPAGEQERRIEAAVHAHLDALAQAHEARVLGSVADMIARHSIPQRGTLPELINEGGESVIRLVSPRDPYYRRLPEEERPYRNADADHWHREWLLGARDNNVPQRMQAEGKLRGMYKDLYARADTLEGTADGSGGFAGGTGGVLLPRPLESLVAIALAKVAKMARWARIYTMSSQEHNVPTAGAATAYMQGEATSPTTGGEPTLGQKPLIAHNAICKVKLGWDFLEDQAANVVPTFVQLAGDALGELEDAQFLRTGTGSAPNVTKLAGVAYAEVSTGTLRYSDVVAMYSNVPQRYRDGARWLVAGNVLQYLRAVLSAADGRPFYQNLLDPPLALGDDAGGQGTLLGKPVHEVDLTPGEIYFGDVGRAYAIGRLRGLRVESSREFLFDELKTVFLIRQRIAGNNIDTSAGQQAAGITAAAIS